MKYIVRREAAICSLPYLCPSLRVCNEMPKNMQNLFTTIIIFKLIFMKSFMKCFSTQQPCTQFVAIQTICFCPLFRFSVYYYVCMYVFCLFVGTFLPLLRLGWKKCNGNCMQCCVQQVQRLVVLHCANGGILLKCELTKYSRRCVCLEMTMAFQAWWCCRCSHGKHLYEVGS